MKKSLFILLSLLITISAWSFNNLSSFDNWTYQVTDLTKDTTYIKRIWIDHDTTINEQTYMVLDNTPIRNEGDKVLAYYNGEEVLLYDFGLNVGDKIRKSLADDPSVMSIVTKVDTIFLSHDRSGSSVPAKRIFYDNRPEDILYIGSVANTGVLSPILGYEMPAGTKQEFLCMCWYNALHFCMSRYNNTYGECSETEPGVCMNEDGDVPYYRIVATIEDEKYIPLVKLDEKTKNYVATSTISEYNEFLSQFQFAGFYQTFMGIKTDLKKSYTIDFLSEDDWKKFAQELQKNYSGQYQNVECYNPVWITDIEEIEKSSDTQSSAVKYVFDGQILIQQEGKIFDLTGKEMK